MGLCGLGCRALWEFTSFGFVGLRFRVYGLGLRVLGLRLWV